MLILVSNLLHKNMSENSIPPPQLSAGKSNNEPIRIGITIGDVNGIGLETIIKTFVDERMMQQCTPIIYGSSKVLSYHKKVLKADQFAYQTISDANNATPGQCYIINCWQDEINITLGRPNPALGVYAHRALEAATEDLKKGKLHAIVTAPVNKNHLNTPENPFSGHTEYLMQKFNAPDSIMLLVSDTLRVGLVTNHIPIRDVSKSITKNLIIKKIQILNRSLRTDFGIVRPQIAVLALNPHASDSGLIGNEEATIIEPAIEQIKNESNILAFGPYAADGFFGSGMYRRFDAILAMYHDQGLVPFKTLSFGHGVNFTAGLPIIRTSPDHGTAYDIAGKNLAAEDSFRQAIFMAVDIYRNRKNYAEMTASPLERNQVRLSDLDDARVEDIIEE